MLSDKNTRLDILNVINDNPGITTNDISKKINIPKSTCIFHINTLKENEQIIIKYYSKKRFFPKDMLDFDIKILIALRTITSKMILLYLMENPEKIFSDICMNVHKSRSTVSIYLSKLFLDKIINIKIKNHKKTYVIVDPNKLKEIMLQYGFLARINKL